MSEVPKISNEALKAATSVASLLPQVAAAAAGASVLGLFAGWRDATAYFSSLGASWFMTALTPSMLIQRAAGLMGLLVLFAFLSIYNLTHGAATAKGLRKYSILLVVAATVLFIVPTLAERWVGKQVVYYCSVAGAFASAISAGLTIGEVVARLVDDELAWGGYHVWLLYLAVSFGLMQAPDRMGYARAQVDGDQKTSSLPKVEVVSGAPEKAWRLVMIAGNQFLLVSLGETPHSHTFRVVDANAISEIRSSLDRP
ncbi:hypothetical protein [Candidatus Methylomirabilis sp.]|uniref:hypothetical protein n=1 Tax=Candidatus Methylomirabilis sp. TaxID=2032687 RepID=UPI003C7074C6